MSLLEFEKGSREANVRFWIDVVNIGLTLTTVLTFEIKQLIRERLAYFKDPWNINDILFLLTFISTFTFDILLLKKDDVD